MKKRLAALLTAGFVNCATMQNSNAAALEAEQENTPPPAPEETTDHQQPAIIRGRQVLLDCAPGAGKRERRRMEDAGVPSEITL